MRLLPIIAAFVLLLQLSPAWGAEVTKKSVAHCAILAQPSDERQLCVGRVITTVAEALTGKPRPAWCPSDDKLVQVLAKARTQEDILLDHVRYKVCELRGWQ